MIVCHHCQRDAHHITYLSTQVSVQQCDCNETWITHQLALGLTPAVRVVDHGFVVTW